MSKPFKIPLVLPPGLVADDTDFTNGGWADASNIRFEASRPGEAALPEMIGGWERLTTDVLPGVCRSLFPWTDGDALKTIAFGLHNGLSVWQEGEVADITPTSDFTAGQINGTGGAGYGTGSYGLGDYGEPSTEDYFPLTWSFGARSFGELYANPRGQGIFVWNNDTSTEAELLTNAPAQCAMVRVGFTDQVMAFGCTDVDDNFRQACIRISDSVDPTIWDPANTSAIAQQINLKGGGRIVGAEQIGRDVLVWTDSELHNGTFGTEWGFEPVATGCGLIGPNAPIIAGQVAYWISPDYQFWVCPLGGSPVILPCPIRSDFEANAASSQNDKIVGAYIAERGEIVWSYADRRDGFECSRMIRMSVRDGSWSRSVLARTAFQGAAPSPIGVTFEGVVYWHERGASADGGQLSAYLETGGQYLEPAQRRLRLRGLWPDFRGTSGSGTGGQIGAITLDIWSRAYPQSPWEHWGSYVIPAGEEKVDFFASGRIFKFRLTSNSAPAAWRLGKLTFDAVVTGEH